MLPVMIDAISIYKINIPEIKFYNISLKEYNYVHR